MFSGSATAAVSVVVFVFIFLNDVAGFFFEKMR